MKACLPTKPMFCSREYQHTLILLQQNEKSTPKKSEAVLKLTHEGHLGLSKCKLCAKDTVYWPGLNDRKNWYWTVNFVWNIPNPSISNNLLYLLVRKYLYMHGQSLQQSFFILRQHHTYWLWITPADFQLCTSYHPWLDSI